MNIRAWNFLYFLLSLSFLCHSCSTEEPEFVPGELSQWINYTTGDGLAENVAKVIFEDSFGNLWIGSESRGVTRFNGSSFTVFNTQNGLINNNVLAIAEDMVNNEIWIGTAGGLSIRIADDDWVYLDQINNVPIQVTALLSDTSGKMWIGTPQFGLLSFDESNGLLQYFDQACEDCNYVNTIFQDSDGTLWFGTSGGLKRRSGSQFTLIDSSDGLPWNDVTAIGEDSWGNLWVGTFAGNSIVYLINNQVRNLSLFNGADVNVIFGIVEEGSGRMWFGSFNHGLMYYDGSIVRTRPPDEDPGRVQVYDMMKDSEGNIWLGTAEKGLWKYITP